MSTNAVHSHVVLLRVKSPAIFQFHVRTRFGYAPFTHTPLCPLEGRAGKRAGGEAQCSLKKPLGLDSWGTNTARHTVCA